MPLTYPFLPQSNRHLQPGHYWAIALASGSYACGRVLAVPPPEAKNRTGFYAGLLNWTGASLPTEQSITGATLLAHGRVHLRTLTALGQPILGYRPLALDNVVLPLTVAQRCWSPGAVLLQGYTIVGLSHRAHHPSRYVPLPDGSGYDEEVNPAALPMQSTWGYQVLPLLAEKYLGPSVPAH